MEEERPFPLMAHCHWSCYGPPSAQLFVTLHRHDVKNYAEKEEKKPLRLGLEPMPVQFLSSSSAPCEASFNL